MSGEEDVQVQNTMEEPEVGASLPKWSWANQAHTFPDSSNFLSPGGIDYTREIEKEWPTSMDLGTGPGERARSVRSYPVSYFHTDFSYYDSTAGTIEEIAMYAPWAVINVNGESGPALAPNAEMDSWFAAITADSNISQTISNSRAVNNLFSAVPIARAAPMVNANVRYNKGTSSADVLTKLFLRANERCRIMTGTSNVLSVAFQKVQPGIINAIANNPSDHFPGTPSWAGTTIPSRACNLTEFVKYLSTGVGSTAISAGWEAEHFGKTTAIVPVRTEHLGQAQINVEWTIAHLEHPFNARSVFKTNQLDVNSKVMEQAFYEAFSHYTFVPGPKDRILFVLCNWMNGDGMDVAGVGLYASTLSVNVDFKANNLVGGTDVDLLPVLHAGLADTNLGITANEGAVSRWVQCYGSQSDWNTAALAAADTSYRYNAPNYWDPTVARERGIWYSKDLDGTTGNYGHFVTGGTDIDTQSDDTITSYWQNLMTTATGLFPTASTSRFTRLQVSGGIMTTEITGADPLVACLKMSGKLTPMDKMTVKPVTNNTDFARYLLQVSLWLASVTDLAIGQANIGTWLLEWRGNPDVDVYRQNFRRSFNKFLGSVPGSSHYRLGNVNVSGSSAALLLTLTTMFYGYNASPPNQWYTDGFVPCFPRVEVEWLQYFFDIADGDNTRVIDLAPLVGNDNERSGLSANYPYWTLREMGPASLEDAAKLETMLSVSREHYAVGGSLATPARFWLEIANTIKQFHIYRKSQAEDWNMFISSNDKGNYPSQIISSSYTVGKPMFGTWALVSPVVPTWITKVATADEDVALGGKVVLSGSRAFRGTFRRLKSQGLNEQQVNRLVNKVFL